MPDAAITDQRKMIRGIDRLGLCPIRDPQRVSKTLRVITVVCLVAVLVISTVSLDVQAGTSDRDSGSLTVTARDATGNLIQEGVVVLYTENWDVVGQKSLNSDGTVQWTGLDAGEYNLELYRTEEEFWGSSEVTISDGERSAITIERREPRTTNVELAEATEDERYRVGEPITISPQVRNDRSFPRSVRVKISVDTDGDGSADETVTRGPVEITGGNSKWYGYEFTPAEPGSVAVRVTVESNIADRWVVTDRMSWTEPIDIEPEETTVRETETSVATGTERATVTETEVGQQQASTESEEVVRPQGGINWKEYLGVGLVLTLILASLYTASKMEWNK